MQIPIVNGIYTDVKGDFRTSFPRNMVPVPQKSGINLGYLRPAPGIVELTPAAPGIDRGAFNWNGVHYRVLGNSLCRLAEDGSVTVIGNVGNDDMPVKFDNSFTHLAIASAGGLYLYDGTTLAQNTDVDLSTVVDFTWVAGYFMTTDGVSLIVTELNNPFAVDPFKYGSSEVDPDPIKAIVRLGSEPHALNRHTIEAFTNVGGDAFPFQRIDGAQVSRGVVGTHACCKFLDRIAFVGGGKKEAISIWLALNGQSERIADREIDLILEGYSEETLSHCVLCARVQKGTELLELRLPDQTLVYDAIASATFKVPVWFVLTSGLDDPGQYRATFPVWVYNRWNVGDPQAARVGYLTDASGNHWGDVVRWDFGTSFLYAEGRSGVVHELELVMNTGNAALGVDSTVWSSYTVDGKSWSQELPAMVGRRGDTLARLVWLQNGIMGHFRAQRFRGTSDAHTSFVQLRAEIEALSV